MFVFSPPKTQTLERYRPIKISYLLNIIPMGGTLIASQRPVMLISHYSKTHRWTEQLDTMPSIYSHPIIPTTIYPFAIALDLKMNQSIIKVPIDLIVQSLVQIHLSNQTRWKNYFRNHEEPLHLYDKSPDRPKTPSHWFSDLHSTE